MGDKLVYENLVMVDQHYKFAEKLLKRYIRNVKFNSTVVRGTICLSILGFGYLLNELQEKHKSIKGLEERVGVLERLIWDSESTGNEQDF